MAHRIEHFFVAGAQRSGTTFLYHALDNHPEIEMARPVRPEPKFFLQPGSGGRREDYLDCFFEPEPAAGVRGRGEKSTSYIEDSAVPGRIVEAFPEARIVFVFRDPVARALSNYRFTRAGGLEAAPLNAALSRELDGEPLPETPDGLSVSPFTYLQRGRYADYLAPFIATFGRTRIHILQSEALWAGRASYDALLGWLGCTPSLGSYAAGEVLNASGRDDEGMDPQLLRRLASYFEASNRDLAENWGLDMTLWSQGV